MKGIVLAGGTGSRLWPITLAVSKQLLPIYDKPLIYYPISTLMSIGIREILVITTPEHTSGFKSLLGSGETWGVSFQYAEQDKPRGLAEAYIIGEPFLNSDSSALILGDNIFHGIDLGADISSDTPRRGATIFGYHVLDPTQYGVVELDQFGRPRSIEEKPSEPRSSLAIPGLYLCDSKASEFAQNVKPSNRGELEITEVLQRYLEVDELDVHVLPEGTAWLDSGTFASLHDASNYVRLLEERQGTKVGCPEEVAWRNGWISEDQLVACASRYRNSGYADHLLRMLDRRNGLR